MDFPADTLAPVQAQPINGEVAKAIGLSKDKIVNIQASEGCQYLVIEVEQSVDIASLHIETFALVK
jgi:hypothetical protein